jgi:hypothetical protein
MASIQNNAPGMRGRTSWRRLVAVLLPSLAAVVILVVLTAQSVLAVSLSISGTPFTVTAKQLKGKGFEQFIIIDQAGRRIGLTANAIRSATLTDLCQSLTVGGLTLRITAGTGSTPVRASDLVVDADRLSGNASFTHIQIGRNASTLNEVPGVTGPNGDFGEQAVTITIDNLRQHAFATTAGTFTLPDFSLSFGGHC